jgi:hypothetical protein
MHTPLVRNLTRAATSKRIDLALTLVGIVGTLLIARSIGVGNTSQLIWYGIVAALGVVALIFAGDWRRGLYFFIVWLLFEDLIRKYMGNNMVIFLAKDALVVVAYVVFLWNWRQGKVHFFRPPFLVPMLFVVWMGLIQVFNPISPSIFYGIVGFKLYFYYIPLMFLSYTLINSERTLQIFLIFNLSIASIVATLGIIQAIVGPDFLNPQTLAPELEQLNRLFRRAPEEGVFFHRPSAVFLSEGRFGWYLALIHIISFGTVVYFFFAGKGWRSLFIPILSLGVCSIAILLHGSRGSFMFILISSIVLTLGVLWYTQLLHKSGASKLRNILPIAGIVAGAILIMILFFPAEFDARWQLYAQTLTPGGEHSQIQERAWEHPVRQFMANVSAPFAPVGYGIGTASQGLLYVPTIFGAPLPDTPRGTGESGFGIIAVELGFMGLFFWLVWTVTLLYYGGRVVYNLRATSFFPIGLAFLWVVVEMMVFFTFGSIMGYQNFVNNAYLWLFTGVLFKLPSLVSGETGETSNKI